MSAVCDESSPPAQAPQMQLSGQPHPLLGPTHNPGQHHAQLKAKPPAIPVPTLNSSSPGLSTACPQPKLSAAKPASCPP